MMDHDDNHHDKGGRKHPRDEEVRDSEEGEERKAKAKRQDIELPSADVDVKLAEMLDNILSLNPNSGKPKFLTNKPKQAARIGPASNGFNNHQVNMSDIYKKPNVIEVTGPKRGKLISRNLTEQQIKERVSKYDYLIQNPKVQLKVVKILNATESVELAKEQAKRQLNRQLELSSVTKNLEAIKEDALRKFRFNDGYERPMKD